MGAVEPWAIYTREQAQELMQLSRASMTKLLTTGQLPASKFGRDWRIWGKDIIAFMESRRRHPAESGER